MEEEILEILQKYTEPQDLDYYLDGTIMKFQFDELAEELVKKFAIPVVSRSNAIDYKKGFELAMQYIDASPCDPDIYIDQLEMWESLQDFIKSNKIK